MPEPAGDTKIPVYINATTHIGLTAYVTENGDPVPSLGETGEYYAVTPGKSAIGLVGGGAKPQDHWEFFVLKTDGTTVQESKSTAFDYTIPEDALYVSLTTYFV